MNYITYHLDDDRPVHFEVEAMNGLQPATSIKGAWASTQQAFTTSVDTALESMKTLIDVVREKMPERPAEIEITFALKAAAELGVWVFSKASAEGNIGIKLVWKKAQ